MRQEKPEICYSEAEIPGLYCGCGAGAADRALRLRGGIEAAYGLRPLTRGKDSGKAAAGGAVGGRK